MKADGHHEFGSLHHSIETSSDRSFGIVFAGAFALIAGYVGRRGMGWWPVPLVLAPTFLVVALVRPSLLAPLNVVWTKLGSLLGSVVAPIVMAVVYFAFFTPMACINRFIGKDFLRLSRDPHALTYWVPRREQGQSPERLHDQF
jgi:hypothetical protein